MRSKTKHELVVNNGKLTPVKRGLESIQRAGTEYEFSIVFDMDQAHNFICTKDRTQIFNNHDIPEPLDVSVANKIIDWLHSGDEMLPPKKSRNEEIRELFVTADSMDELKSLWTSLSIDEKSIFNELKEETKDRLTNNAPIELEIKDEQE
jgi:hypothetical protein